MDDAPGTQTRRILVTGACGFIGANVCHYFLEQGWQVFGVLGPQGRSWRLPPQPRLITHQVDLLDAVAVAAVVRDVRPNLIVNCAAFGAYASQVDAERVYQVNVLGLRNLLESARNLPALQAAVQLGSSSEYGANCEAPAEEAPCWPDSDYAVSKVAATALMRFYALKHAVPAFTMRLYSVYGPFEDMSRLIPQLTLRARRGTWPPLVDPDISRDFIYVGDVCCAIEEMFKNAPKLRKGDVFNIGSGVCCTLRDLVACAQDLFNVEEVPRWSSMQARHWDHTKWYGNPRHAQQAFGWRTQTSLQDGLSRTMAWVEANPSLVQAGLQSSVLGAI